MTYSPFCVTRQQISPHSYSYGSHYKDKHEETGLRNHQREIFTLEYDSSDTINISALSSELGVSNTPIREALSRLEVEGLVTSTLNSKVQVIDISEDLYKDIDHTFFSIISGCYTTCFLEDRTEPGIQSG